MLLKPKAGVVCSRGFALDGRKAPKLFDRMSNGMQLLKDEYNKHVSSRVRALREYGFRSVCGNS